MEFQVASHQSEAYHIDTDVYSGPLDLLLQLIEKAELDITKLALAQVTDQYLEYMHQLEQQNAAEVSAFLVIAARLVQIKSAALLPRPIIPGIQFEEDPGEALARQLLIYKRFKELAINLEQRETDGLKTYLRLDSSPRTNFQSRLDLSEFTLESLVQAAADVLGNNSNLAPLSDVVSFPRITIREKITTILEELRKGTGRTFQSILSDSKSRVEIVVTFLALLELVKRHLVGVNQNNLFGSIELTPEGELSNLEDQDLEFVE